MVPSHAVLSITWSSAIIYLSLCNFSFSLIKKKLREEWPCVHMFALPPQKWIGIFLFFVFLTLLAWHDKRRSEGCDKRRVVVVHRARPESTATDDAACWRPIDLIEFTDIILLRAHNFTLKLLYTWSLKTSTTKKPIYKVKLLYKYIKQPFTSRYGVLRWNMLPCTWLHN